MVTLFKCDSLMSNYKEDEKLLEKLKTNDRMVWKQFFDDHHQAFLLFIMKYAVIDKSTAIEKYQDAMVIFHRKVTNNDLNAPLQSALKTYLIGIGKMLCRQKGKMDDHTDEIPEIAIVPLVENEAEKKHQKELVRKLLSLLDERCRQILTLIFIKGYATEAVASELDLPSEGAVRKGQYDCLKKMRKMM